MLLLIFAVIMIFSINVNAITCEEACGNISKSQTNEYNNCVKISNCKNYVEPKSSGSSSGSGGTFSCSSISTLIADLHQHIYKPIKWGTPLLLLFLTAFDFAKVVFTGDGKGMDKAKNNFLKRLVAALVIFFAPEIIELLGSLITNESITSCVSALK